MICNEPLHTPDVDRSIINLRNLDLSLRRRPAKTANACEASAAKGYSRSRNPNAAAYARTYARTYIGHVTDR